MPLSVRPAALCLTLLVPWPSSCRTVSSPDVRIVRAEAYTRAEAWVNAASIWTEIYRASSGEDRRAGLESAHAFLASGKPAVAVARLSELRQRWPADAEVHERLGEAQEAVGEPSAALISYAAALELDPSRPVSLARVGILGAAAGLPTAAQESLWRLRASGALDDAGSDSLFELGMAAAREGRLEEAYGALSSALETGGLGMDRRLSAATALAPDPRVVPWLTEVIRQDPLHTVALTLLGTTQLRMGFVERGLQSLEQAVSSDPSDVRAVRAYAEALEGAGQPARADEVRALLPEGEPAGDAAGESAGGPAKAPEGDPDDASNGSTEAGSPEADGVSFP